MSLKFVRREIDEIVRYLLEKQNKILPVSQTFATPWIAKKSVKASPQQCTRSVPDYIQIGLLSAEL